MIEKGDTEVNVCVIVTEPKSRCPVRFDIPLKIKVSSVGKYGKPNVQQTVHCNCTDLHPTEEYIDITVEGCRRKACIKIPTGPDEFQLYALTLMKIPGRIKINRKIKLNQTEAVIITRKCAVYSPSWPMVQRFLLGMRFKNLHAHVRIARAPAVRVRMRTTVLTYIIRD